MIYGGVHMKIDLKQDKSLKATILNNTRTAILTGLLMFSPTSSGMNTQNFDLVKLPNNKPEINKIYGSQGKYDSNGLDTSSKTPIASILTYVLEGFEDPSQKLNCEKPHVPDKYSGITISHGLDLKTKEPDDIKKLLIKSDLSPKVAEQIIKGIGLKGKAARKYISTTMVELDDGSKVLYKDLKFDSDTQRKIFNNAIVAYQNKTRQLFTLNGIDPNIITDQGKRDKILELATDFIYHGWKFPEGIAEGFKDLIEKGDKTKLMQELAKPSNYTERNKARLKFLEKLD